MGKHEPSNIAGGRERSSHGYVLSARSALTLWLPKNDMKQARSLSDLLGLIALANVVIIAQWRGGPRQRQAVGMVKPQSSTSTGTHADSQTGKGADAPTKIPPRGWFQIFKRTALQVGANELLAQAAGVTFYGLLSIFPAIAATVSLYGLVADPSTISEHLDTLAGVIPGGGMDIITDQVRRLTQNPSSALSFGAIVGVLTALWSANAGSKALFSALNAVYEEKEKRNFFVLTAASLAFTVGAVAFLVVALGVMVVLPLVLDLVGLKTAFTTVLQIARWPAIVVTIAIFLACLYRFGPSRAEPRWRWVTWGSAVASIGWIALSGGFSWYVGHFGSYNKTYGSLGAAVGFMTWIWLSTTVVLVGAQLNAEIENQTERDTTVGSPKPIGSRGARKADTVA